MIVTKQQLADIIQLAKVMIDNHPEEVEGNPSIVKRIELLAKIEDCNKLEVTSNLKSICIDAAGEIDIESYSALINAASYEYKNDEAFKAQVEFNEDINIPKAVTLIGCYLGYTLPSQVLKLAKG